MPGRKPKYQEFLITLREVTGTNTKQFASLIGKSQGNVSNYLSGKAPVGKRAVKSAVSHLSEGDVRKDVIMLPTEKKKQISAQPGIYFIYDSAGNCVYLGQGQNLRTEVSQRLRTKKLRHGIWRDPKMKLTRYFLEDVAAFISTFVVPSKRLRHNLEALFLHTVINQTQNSKKGTFR